MSDRERKRAAQRKYNAKVRADPARYAAEKEKNRRRMRGYRDDPVIRARLQAASRNYLRRLRSSGDPRYVAQRMLSTARRAARLKKLPFLLTIADIKIPAACPVFGVPFHLRGGVKGRRSPWAPSLDRLRPTKGYVAGNVRVISWRANGLKSNGTVQEFGALLNWMRCEIR